MDCILSDLGRICVWGSYLSCMDVWGAHSWSFPKDEGIQTKTERDTVVQYI
jgi:hypothetical protein